MHPTSIRGTNNEPATSYSMETNFVSIHKPPERSMHPTTTSPLETQNASSNQPENAICSPQSLIVKPYLPRYYLKERR
ncbi:hypothetical protein DPMN_029823 [Dreissena polymorpha]|uniref:Uncharacterized protein n=1 Tax=Dreissena polymorpha TaxID=45954 RepID=A0A9D4LZT4_DREPO|nr:hypothetical protein DPMN_029595 [Dreissena polymorpha]KAH3866724.1 hypothetical protein DPMN_029823 [Dreissena polymorpha]